MTTNYLRRAFLQKALTLAGTVVFTPFISNSSAWMNQSNDDSQDEKLTPRINPAFRINLYDDGTLELFTFQKPGSKISYHYNGIEAAILVLIIQNKPIKPESKEFASKFSLSESEYNLKISLVLDEFKKKGLIYYGDMMMVKKNEVTHEENIPNIN